MALGSLSTPTNFEIQSINIEFLMIFWNLDPKYHKKCDKIRIPDRIRIIFGEMKDNGSVHICA